MMLTKGSGIRTERESGMRLNPEYKLLAVGEHDLLVNEKSDRYFEIDAAAAALIRRIEYAEKTSDHVSVGTAGERTDKISDDADEAVLTTWLAGKKILLEDGEVVPKSRSENRLKEITKIRLFSIPVNDFFESHHRADRIARSERLPAMITVFSVIGLLLMLGGAGFLVLEGQYLPREATAAQVLWMMPAVYILGLLITWFHELGHVLLCRHYCHYVGRCGLMLFFFTPAFYTNTTVSQFAGKKERTEIILAGIRMQLILGGILSALTVWSAAMGWKAGLLFFLLNILNVIYVILNLNPLFKYDGYWLLAVRWNIGHLYERSVYEVIRRLKKIRKEGKNRQEAVSLRKCTDLVLPWNVECCDRCDLELSVSEDLSVQPDPGRAGGDPDHKRDVRVGEKLSEIFRSVSEEMRIPAERLNHKISGKERLGR